MSDPDTRPLKRARISTDDLADSQNSPSCSSFTSSNLHRHPEIWYDDGNLVLVARETAFRIYRELIAGQSTVFSDLFASSTASPNETLEGCPVIHLSDSPHDLVHLLRVLLPQSRIYYHTTRESHMRTLDELSAVIRLTHKYNISQVLEQALSALHEYGFATPFTAFSSLPPHSARALDLWNDIGGHNIGVVNLARLTDTPALLPLALYHCAYLGGDVFDGWTREDGTVEHLASTDLRRCVEARAALVHAHTAFLFSVFDSDATVSSAACAHPAGCAACLRRAQGAFVCSGELALLHHPLRHSWGEAVSMLRESEKLCPSCAGEMLERTREGQRKVFDKLPEMFGITVEGWGTDSEETETAALDGEGG